MRNSPFLRTNVWEMVNSGLPVPISIVQDSICELLFTCKNKKAAKPANVKGQHVKISVTFFKTSWKQNIHPLFYILDILKK